MAAIGMAAKGVKAAERHENISAAMKKTAHRV